jgi:hypothetical protein
MDQTASAVLFIRRHAPELAHWTDFALVSWASFAAKRKRLVCVFDPDRAIVGLGAARCLTGAQDADDWYAHDEGGDTVFVDLVLGKGVLPVLWDVVKQRYGTRKRLAFRRFRDDRRREYDMESFDNHLKHHGK